MKAAWKTVRLGSIAKTGSGGTPKRGVSTYYGGGIPWVKSGELGDSTVYETGETISQAGLDSSSAKVFPKGTLCVALYGATVGKLGILGLDAATNQAVCGIFLPPEIDTRFAYRFLESKRRDLIEMGKGGAQSNISQEIIRELQFPLPSLDEQQRIVAEIEKQFTRLDAGVTALRKVKAKFNRYRAAVLKAACEGRLVPTEAELARQEGRPYESASELLAHILAERRQHWRGRGKYSEPLPPEAPDHPSLPEGWAWARLQQLGLVFGGLTKNPKRAKLTKQLPYLRVANVYANKLRLHDIEYIGVEDAELDKLIVLKGDLLIVEGNGSKDQIGRAAIWDGSIEPCVHQNHLIKVRLVKSQMPKWTIYWMQSPAGRAFVEMVASSTSGLYTLSVNKVGDLPIALPPLAEQVRIVAEVERRLSVIEELETNVATNLQRVTRLRQSILYRAFSGNLIST